MVADGRRRTIDHWHVIVQGGRFVEPETAPTPSPKAPASAPSSSLWTRALPVLSILISLGVWYQTHRDLTTLTRSQQELRADLDAARGQATISVAGAPALGPADQVVTLIEFADYECPFCIRHFTQTMPQLEAQYIQTGRIRYVFKDFPIDQLHPGAIRAHQAARCAAEQGKFWEMHTRMFSQPGSHDDGTIEAKAAEAGVGVPALRDCLASDRTTAAVRQNVQLAQQLGATGTPSFFVGLRDPSTDDVRILTAITGAQPLSVFEQAIAAVAARAKS